MKRYIDKHNNFGCIWSATTKHFTIKLYLDEDYGYQYDGDDEDGSIQAALDAGDLVAFDSKVAVELDGIEIGASHLGGSVYHDGRTLEFLQSGYFMDMLHEACQEARELLADRPTLRKA